MRKRRSLLGLLILAGVVSLAIVALRERPAPSRSVPRPAPEAKEAEGRTDATPDGESDLAEGTLWGTVTVPEGIDVTDVRLSIFTKLGIYRSSNTGVSPFKTSLKVGQDGTFRGDGLPLGQYQLLAKHPSCASCRMQFELRPDRGTGPLRVVLEPGSLLVRIVGPNGRGLSGELVALHRGEGTPEHIEYRLEPARPQVGEGSTDTDGEVRFANLESGTYTLTRRGTVVEQRSAEVRPGDETVVLFDARASLFGRLLGHDGQPIPAARLFLRASGGRIYETGTDDGGAFAVRGIAAGEYRVTASVKGLGTVPLAETLVVEDRSAHEQDLRLPAVRLVVAVVHAESGAPFSRSASVQASGIVLDHLVSARATTDGRFELTGLYPGRYTVSAHPTKPDDGFDERASEVVTVTPVPATQELVLRVSRVAKTARLRLTVRDRDGGPAEEILLVGGGTYTQVTAGGKWRCPEAKLVEPGVYDVLLVPGAHRILVMTPPGGPRYYAEVSVEVEAGEVAEKTVTLEKLLEGD